ncbi:MAG TPA: P27 family phage terminase small subunit [Gaiellales bacterium]|jgi:hypothetical protein|nr:P27 family phage terminase small subunit [Gaiellales bacterium]
MTGRASLPRARRGLHAVAKAARKEALEHLGDQAGEFSAMLDRYVNAVEVADAARREWERLDRPLIGKYANGTEGLHPLVSTMERLDRAANRYAGELGLTPASAKRLGGIGRIGRIGRPMGANSAPDRKAPPVLTLAPRPGVTLKGAKAAAVNRARQHPADD